MFNRNSVLEDMQRVITPLQNLLTTVAAKVDTLSADHVTRADMATLRREVSDGFSALDERFVRRDMGDARYAELKEMDGKQEKRLETLEALVGATTTTSTQHYMQINDRILTIALSVAGGVFIALIGYVLSHLR